CGAVWWPHPGPLPHGEGANTKKRKHVCGFVLTWRLFKTNKHQHNPHPQQQRLQAAVIHCGHYDHNQGCVL
ncbi:hypothetical protein, partial [Enterobacter intestinihominis]